MLDVGEHLNNHKTFGCWNINVVKSKSDIPDIKNLFESHGIVVICETPLKYSENFVCINPSAPITSIRPRGVIAIYKKLSWPYQVEAAITNLGIVT